MNLDEGEMYVPIINIKTVTICCIQKHQLRAENAEQISLLTTN